MSRPLCIYHATCVDGFAAAWVVRRYFQKKTLGQEVDFHASQYGDAPPDVTGRDVIMVDFSFKRPVLDELAHQARSVLILDHHKTAQEDLAGLPVPHGGWDGHATAVLQRQAQDHIEGTRPIVYALFDMKRSGAGLAWDFFFPAQHRFPLIDLVEDRDLWRFTLPHTREINATLASHPWDFAVWDRLVDEAQDREGRDRLAAEGRAIDRKLQKDIAAILSVEPRQMVIGGVVVPVVNAPGIWASDAAGKLAEAAPFAAVYFDMPHARVFSLRSRREGGLDVSEIAKKYGGGGHPGAAGFQVPLGWEGDGSLDGA